jgi:hypothetical protein
MQLVLHDASHQREPLSQMVVGEPLWWGCGDVRVIGIRRGCRRHTHHSHVPAGDAVTGLGPSSATVRRTLYGKDREPAAADMLAGVDQSNVVRPRAIETDDADAIEL